MSRPATEVARGVAEMLFDLAGEWAPEAVASDELERLGLELAQIDAAADSSAADSQGGLLWPRHPQT